MEETLTGETEGEQPTETGSEEGLEVSGRPAGTNKPGGQMEILDETPPPYEPVSYTHLDVYKRQDKYCSFMPVPIFLDNAKAEPQYETIEKDELTDKDTIVETVVEPAKTEEKENENGEKETVEVAVSYTHLAFFPCAILCPSKKS